METLARHLRHALRSLQRTPAFTAAAVLVLAIGIGMATAMFTVFRAVVLRDLPVRDPDRIVTLWTFRDPTVTLALIQPQLDGLRRNSRTLHDAAGAGALGRPGHSGDGGWPPAPPEAGDGHGQLLRGPRNASGARSPVPAGRTVPVGACSRTGSPSPTWRASTHTAAPGTSGTASLPPHASSNNRRLVAPRVIGPL